MDPRRVLTVFDASRRIPNRRGSGLFLVVVGFLVGVLIAALLFAEHSDPSLREGGLGAVHEPYRTEGLSA